MKFFTHVSDTLKGALIGQIIPVLALPVIARLYAPADYGVYASILSIAIILSVVISLQLELGIVLPKEEDEAQKIAKSAVQMSLYASVSAFIIFCVFNAAAHHYDWLPHQRDWILLAPVIALFMALIQIGGHCVSRLRHYNALGNAAAIMQLINCGSAVILGYFHSALSMLLAARILGQGAALLPFRQGWAWLCGHYRTSGWLRFKDMCAVIKRYPKFPVFTVPLMLAMTISREMIVVVLIFFHHPQAAGFYALARAVLMMPASLVSTTIGQIFYREAASALEETRFRDFMYRLVVTLAAVATPGCIILALWGAPVFETVFGSAWREAGQYASIYMPVAFLFILNNTFGRVFELHNRQDILFRLQISFEILSFGFLIAALMRDAPVFTAVSLYLIVQAVYLMTHLFIAFRLMRFSALRYGALFGMVTLGAAVTLGVHLLTGLPDWSLPVRFGVEMLVVLLALFGLILWFWRKFQLGYVLELAKEDAVNYDFAGKDKGL